MQQRAGAAGRFIEHQAGRQAAGFTRIIRVTGVALDPVVQRKRATGRGNSDAHVLAHRNGGQGAARRRAHDRRGGQRLRGQGHQQQEGCGQSVCQPGTTVDEHFYHSEASCRTPRLGCVSSSSVEKWPMDTGRGAQVCGVL